jgi:proteic killer suppression protein
VSKSFKHKGLKRFYETGSTIGEHQKRLRVQLAALDTARQTMTDMDIPGFRLHPLKGDRKGCRKIEGCSVDFSAGP